MLRLKRKCYKQTEWWTVRRTGKHKSISPTFNESGGQYLFFASDCFINSCIMILKMKYSPKLYWDSKHCNGYSKIVAATPQLSSVQTTAGPEVKVKFQYWEFLCALIYMFLMLGSRCQTICYEHCDFQIRTDRGTSL